MYTSQTTKVHLARDEWYEFDAPVDGSNQPRRPGTFRMEVREVEHRHIVDHVIGNGDYEAVYVHGRRYKADGSLGSIVATAPVAEIADLPEPVMTALLEALGDLAGQEHPIRFPSGETKAMKCWCDGEVGPRTPGDFDGNGCLNDVTHEWDAMDCRNCEDIDPGASHALDQFCLRDKCEPGCALIAPHPGSLCVLS